MMKEEDVNALWEALKQECCSDPKEAVRIVMLSKAEFERVMKNAAH